MTSSETQRRSPQKTCGTATGSASASRANNGTYNRRCHMTMGSASRSLTSTSLRRCSTSGRGVNTSQPTCANQKPRRASCGSAFVSEYLWCTRWSLAHVNASLCARQQKHAIHFYEFMVEHHPGAANICCCETQSKLGFEHARGSFCSKYTLLK